MISIVDYGMGNLGSVLNMFKKINVAARLVQNPDELNMAEKILLPGVGSFDKAMQKINENGFREILDRKALNEKIPVLGICLGMQLLTNESEEGTLPGLSWINASTKRFPKDMGLKVPHMGWNIVDLKEESLLTRNLDRESRFYFVHSYYVKVANPINSILSTKYGISFDSAIQKDNIYGAQFHPEKSHKFGMQLLKNFAAL